MLGIQKEAVTAFLSNKGWEGPGGQKQKLSEALRGVVDEAWKPLFTSLGDLAKDKTIPSIDLLDASVPQTATSGGWDWKLTADVDAQVEIDALDADDLKTHHIQDVPGQTVVRYTVAAGFGAGVSGSQKSGPWVFGLSLAGEAAGQFDWFISGPPDKTLGEAIVNAIDKGDFVSPMSLGEQLKRAGQTGYWGTSTRLTGTLSASATVGANVAGAGWSWGLTGKREQIGFSLGVSGSASLKLDGSFQLRVIPERVGTRWALRVTLERMKTSEKSLGLALSAGIDFSALARSAREFLDARLPKTAPLSALAAKLSDPGTAVRDAVSERLTGAIGDAKVLQLIKLTLGDPDASAQDLAATLAAGIADPLTNKLDEAGGELIDAGKGVGSRIKSWLAGLLGVAEKDLPNPLTSAIDGAVEDAASGLNKQIEVLAEQIAGQPKDAIQKILDPFGALGEHVAQALNQVSSSVSEADAVVAIKAGIQRYGVLRKQVLDVLGDAQRAKLLANVALSVEETSSVQTMFSALFLTADAASERLFAGLWRGQLNELIEVVAAAKAAGSVEDVSGWLLRSFERVKTEAVSVTMLGYSFSQARVSTTQLSLKSDTSGNIIAASGSAVSKEVTQNHWTTRQANLGVSAKLIDPGLASARASLEIAGAFIVSGQVMDADFLGDLQRSLGPQGADGHAVRRLLETDATRNLDDKKFWAAVTFMLPLAMDDVEWRFFTSRSQAQIKRAVAQAAVDSINQTFRGDGAYGTPPAQYLLDLGRDRSPGDVLSGLVSYLEDLPRSRKLDQSAILKLETLGFEGLKVSIETSAHRVARTTLRLGHLMRAVGDLATVSISLRQTLTATPARSEQETFDACRDVLKRMTEALEPIAVSSLTFTGLGENVPWPLVTFANAMAALVGRPRFVPIVTIAGAEDRPIPLLAL
ncbi:hypothetical protein CDL60_18005 [Roseateles noduli]|nr:hypothetical protein CDL60_18005 [Roseateles noduli]